MQMRTPLPFVLALSSALLLVSCGGGSGSTSVGAVLPNSFGVKASGEYFLGDDHQRGRASAIRVEEVRWGRLVDVFDVDALGNRGVQPVLRDFVIRETLMSNGSDYRLERNVATGIEELTILRTATDAPSVPGDFFDLLSKAEEDLPLIEAKGIGDQIAGPFDVLPRNAALVVQFDDLLEDGPDAARVLPNTVQLAFGYPPVNAFPVRTIFDPNHGGMVGDEFHSTRVILDTVVSVEESSLSELPLPENGVGLPESQVDVDRPSLALRIPSVTDPSGGVFTLLTNPRGRPVSTTGEPMDEGSTTQDLVRGMRAGDRDELSNGFLFDQRSPQLLGRFAMNIEDASAFPGDVSGREFLVDLTFTTLCRRALIPGEAVEAGTLLFEVAAASGAPDAAGRISNARLRLLTDTILPPSALLGGAHLLTAFDPTLAVSGACWVDVIGADPADLGQSLDPRSLFRLRFSEAMAPASLDPLTTLVLHRGSEADAVSRVVSRILQSPNGREPTLAPLLAMDHEAGQAEVYHLDVVGDIGGLIDLAGNPLEFVPPPIELTMDPNAPTFRGGGITLDFAERDELSQATAVSGGGDDLRGQVNYDLDRDRIIPRPVMFESWPTDGTIGPPSLMLSLPLGFNTPLSPMGSKMMTLWRYADFGWRVEDESKYDLDVDGISWRPFVGSVVSELYPEFEMRLAHSSRLPDEVLLMPGVLAAPTSGLLDAPEPFASNVLEPEGMRVVHPASRGYQVDASDVFLSSTGVRMIPFPLHREGGPRSEFTWRDTTIQLRGGPENNGVPMGIEAILDPSISVGSVAASGEVPSFGLPLLMDFRARPSDSGLGVNGLSLAVASAGQLFPTYRLHSTGGVDTVGNRRLVEPDLELVPGGGFNPTSSPPGQPTRSADPAFHFGQLDTVTRVSRAITAWIESGFVATDWARPVLRPETGEQPAGTRIELEFRGALGFVDSGGSEFDAAQLDAYGELTLGSAMYPDGDPSWTSNIDDLDGLPYVQVRFTFVNNVESGLSPELDSFSLAFRER